MFESASRPSTLSVHPGLRAEFPTVEFEVGSVASDMDTASTRANERSGDSGTVEVSLSEWLDTGDGFRSLDEKLETLEERDAWVEFGGQLDSRVRDLFDAPAPAPAAHAQDAAQSLVSQFLTRYQRLSKVDARVAAQLQPALVAHRQLHDCSKPLVRADYDHSLDTWRWALRLEPEASTAVQLAALFHDIERLESEAEVRIEQHAPDYQRFKDKHGNRGAHMAASVLATCGYPDHVCASVMQLIGTHERPVHAGKSAEATLLADADALSFFSLNSPGFIDYYGPAHTRFKIAFSLGRMSPRARRHLQRTKLRRDVHAILSDVLMRTQGAPHRDVRQDSPSAA